MNGRPGNAGGSHGQRRAGRGFTLIELMMTIAVFAILVALAIPSFRNASLGARLSSAANDLLASVQLARSEAIKRNQPVTLCASSDGATCAGAADWEQGWVVLDAAGNVIQARQAYPAGMEIAEAAALDQLIFQAIGVGATAASFTVCQDDPVGGQERVLTVTATGTTFVTITTAGACP